MCKHCDGFLTAHRSKLNGGFSWVDIPGPIDADILLRHILRRALRRAGLPPLHFHDLRHMAETLTHEAGGSAKSGSRDPRAYVGADHCIYLCDSMRHTHDDSADSIAILVGLTPPANLGNKMGANDSAGSQEPGLLAPRDGTEIIQALQSTSRSRFGER